MTPRPQPHGLATGRGQFERAQRGGRSARRPSAAVGAKFLAAAAATTPPTESTGNAGTSIVVPRPVGALADGDFLMGVVVAHAHDPITFQITPDETWSTVRVGNKLFISRSIVDLGSEPSQYGFTCALGGRSRSACIAAYRFTSILAAAFGQFVLGTMTNPTAGSVLQGQIGCLQGVTGITTPTEQFAPISDEVVAAQHVAQGNIFFSSGAATCVVYKPDLAAGVISGRGVTNTGSETTTDRLSIANILG